MLSRTSFHILQWFYYTAIKYIFEIIYVLFFPLLKCLGIRKFQIEPKHVDYKYNV